MSKAVLDIPERLLRQAMELSGLKKVDDVVNLALKEFVEFLESRNKSTLIKSVKK